MVHKKIRLNPDTLLLEAVEAAFKYEIDPSLEPSLKNYFKNSPYLMLSSWYDTLSEEETKKVKRSSAYL
jgi:predicted glycosyltransferase